MKGLTTEQALQSRALHGQNVLTPQRRKSLWTLYVEKYKDPIIQILLVAAAISLALSMASGDFVEIIGILAAILLATTVGFVFEVDAQKKFDILSALGEEQAVKVVRDGEVTEIMRKDVVVGDVVIVETGDEIPADGRLVESSELMVDESTLTGEPMTEKRNGNDNENENENDNDNDNDNENGNGNGNENGDVNSEGAYPADWLLRSSLVLSGRGVMRVTAVGDMTEIGKVARHSAEAVSIETPLNRQLNRLATLISKVGSAIAVTAFLTFLIHDIVSNPAPWRDGDWLMMANTVLKYFMMAVTLIVMAVPEGLPMAVTLSLALNMKRMLATGNLVRTLQASETMGAVNVICTDKTGTLTQNKMTVSEVIVFDGDEIAEAMSVNSTAELNRDKNIGNPTEVAMLRWLEKKGIDYKELRRDNPTYGQVAFSTEKKYMATATRDFIFVKGAPEIVLTMCENVTDNDNHNGVLLRGDQRSPFEAKAARESIRSLSERGMRTLALCRKNRSVAERLTEANLPHDGYTLQAIVAISDPVREDVPGAVEECRDAGIEVKMVTGDNAATAAEIARQIGILPKDGEVDADAVITGKEWGGLSDVEALERAGRLVVMSRARPHDKQRLVDLLRQRGNVVAVTGDGTNDAPALHHAHVGLSLGSGTSVAKSASDITLLDDSFGSISKAVMWGRSLYKNIQRFLFFQLVVNLSALLLVVGGSIIGTEMPLTVTQILWVNLIMDTFAALALASLPPSHEVMREKPRQTSDFIITRLIGKRIVFTALIFFVVMFAMLIYCERRGSAGVDVHELTIFFTTFVMLQLWNLFNAKSLGSTHSAFHNIGKSGGMLLVLLLIVAGQVMIVSFGGRIFRTVPLTFGEWLTIMAATSAVLWIGEIERLWKRKK